MEERSCRKRTSLRMKEGVTTRKEKVRHLAMVLESKLAENPQYPVTRLYATQEGSTES